MSTRSLNKVMLIGNMTRDPNLRYTPNGTAVCSFGIATNRTWTPSDGGEKQEKAEYHNIVAWGKLADICGQLLHKGDKVYVEGRLQTRDWKGDDGQDRKTTEIVIENMMLLSQGRGSSGGRYQNDDQNMMQDDPSISSSPADDNAQDDPQDDTQSSKSRSKRSTTDIVADVEDVADDIPF